MAPVFGPIGQGRAIRQLMLAARGRRRPQGEKPQHQVRAQAQQAPEQPALHLISCGGPTILDVVQHGFELGMKFLYNDIWVVRHGSAPVDDGSSPDTGSMPCLITNFEYTLFRRSCSGHVKQHRPTIRVLFALGTCLNGSRKDAKAQKRTRLQGTLTPSLRSQRLCVRQSPPFQAHPESGHGSERGSNNMRNSRRTSASAGSSGRSRDVVATRGTKRTSASSSRRRRPLARSISQRL